MQCVPRVYLLEDIIRAVIGFHRALLDSNEAFVTLERKDPFTLLIRYLLLYFLSLYENTGEIQGIVDSKKLLLMSIQIIISSVEHKKDVCVCPDNETNVRTKTVEAAFLLCFTEEKKSCTFVMVSK